MDLYQLKWVNMSTMAVKKVKPDKEILLWNRTLRITTMNLLFKKAENATAFLKKHGLPKSISKKSNRILIF